MNDRQLNQRSKPDPVPLCTIIMVHNTTALLIFLFFQTNITSQIWWSAHTMCNPKLYFMQIYN